MDEPLPVIPAVRSRWRRRAMLLLRLVVIAAVGVGLYFFLRGLRPAELGRALRHARLWPVALAAVLAFGNLFCRAICWRVMLASVARVPVRWLFRYTIAAFAASRFAG